MESLTLVCWACRKEKHLQVSSQPQSVFQFLNIVREAGWLEVLDLEHSRSLPFCSEECLSASKTKSGRIKARRPKMKERV